MTRADYYERQAQKLERYTELAQKKEKEGKALLDRAHQMADVIPFGQPILIDHYSEKRDRNYRDRIQNTWEKGAETIKAAEHYTRKVQAIESNRAISSDAPDAIELLRVKLAKCEKFQEDAKKINKIVRKKITQENQIALLVSEVGLKEETAKLCFVPDCFGNLGIPPYKLTGNNAEIKRLKKRIEVLEKEKTEVPTETIIGNITITDSVEENRVMIVFPGIPDENIREKLKRDGFRWSPSNGAWQAYRSAAWKIPYIVTFLTAMPAYVTPITNYRQPRDNFNLYLTGCYFNEASFEPTEKEIIDLFYEGIRNYPDWISPEMITMQRCTV